jgi:uncharacterized membrane protein YtjA (UPF0391 family)
LLIIPVFACLSALICLPGSTFFRKQPRLRYAMCSSFSVALPCPAQGLFSTFAEGVVMLHFALLLLAIGLFGALFGFGFVAGTTAGVAKLLFLVFIGLAVLMFLRILTYRPTV